MSGQTGRGLSIESRRRGMMIMHAYIPRNAHFENHYGVGVIRGGLVSYYEKVLKWSSNSSNHFRCNIRAAPDIFDVQCTGSPLIDSSLLCHLCHSTIYCFQWAHWIIDTLSGRRTRLDPVPSPSSFSLEYPWCMFHNDSDLILVPALLFSTTNY